MTNLPPHLEDERRLEHIEKTGVNLTDWEKKFVEDIREKIDRGAILTPGQRKSLEDIYTDRTP